MKKVRRQAAIFCIRFSGGQRLALFRRLCYIGSGGERTMKNLLGFFLAVFILVSPALAAGGNTVVYITRLRTPSRAATAPARCVVRRVWTARSGRGMPSRGADRRTVRRLRLRRLPRRRQPHQRLPLPRHRLQRRRRTLRPRHLAREAGCSGPPAVRPLRRASTRFPALSNAGLAGRRKSNKG